MMRTGDELAEYTCFWIRRNYRSFVTLMHLLHCEIDAGNPCVQRGDMFSLARKHGIGISELDEIKRDNTLWAGITRYMVMLSPHLSRALSFRHSALDDVDMVAAWHRYVNPRTLFYAKDRYEAQEACRIGDITASNTRRRNGSNRR